MIKEFGGWAARRQFSCATQDISLTLCSLPCRAYPRRRPYIEIWSHARTQIPDGSENTRTNSMRACTRQQNLDNRSSPSPICHAMTMRSSSSDCRTGKRPVLSQCSLLVRSFCETTAANVTQFHVSLPSLYFFCLNWMNPNQSFRAANLSPCSLIVRFGNRECAGFTSLIF